MLTFADAQIQKIIDIDPFILPFGLIMPDHNLSELADKSDILAPDHVDFANQTLLLGVHSFLVRINDKNIVIDSCVGEDKPRPRRADWHERKNSGYLARLASAGLRAEDIDYVMCTHLHADHVGWNTRLENGRWVPTFPNARYLVGTKELAHWQANETANPGQANHGCFEDSVQPLLEADQVETVDEGFALLPGLEITSLSGHSPGQIGLKFQSKTKGSAHFCGDAFHSPLQVFRPDWSSAFCHDKDQAAALRHRLRQEAAEENTLLLPAHLRGCLGMRVKQSADDFWPEFV